MPRCMEEHMLKHPRNTATQEQMQTVDALLAGDIDVAKPDTFYHLSPPHTPPRSKNLTNREAALLMASSPYVASDIHLPRTPHKVEDCNVFPAWISPIYIPLRYPSLSSNGMNLVVDTPNHTNTESNERGSFASDVNDK